MANIESRRSDGGTISHRVKVRLKGHNTESATFARLTDAKRWAQATEAAMREGRHFKTAEAKRHTLADLVDRYIREVLPHKPKNASNTQLHLLWWKAKLGHLSLADVTAAAIVLLDSAGAGLWGILVPLWFFIAACGFTLPSVQVIALNAHGHEAGTAASLLGAGNFGVAGLISPVVGLLGVGNAIPMGAVMGSTALVSILALWFVVRPHRVAALSH